MAPTSPLKDVTPFATPLVPADVPIELPRGRVEFGINYNDRTNKGRSGLALMVKTSKGIKPYVTPTFLRPKEKGSKNIIEDVIIGSKVTRNVEKSLKKLFEIYTRNE